MNLLHRYPIVSFFILALILGGGMILLVIRGVIPAAMALSSVFSASIAGIIMTALLDGKPGLKLLFSRLLVWRVGIGYWLFSILFLVPAFLIGSLLNPIFHGTPLTFSHLKPGFSLLPMFILFFFVVGVGQELGWTGFLLPRLQARFSAFNSCLMRAILVAFWHLPLLIYSYFEPYALTDFPYGAWMVQKGLLIPFAVLFVLSLVWSIFHAWLFNNTNGSLLLVAVLHGSEIWLAYWMLRTGINQNNLDNYWGYVLIMALTAGLVVILTGPQNLSRKHNKIIHNV